MGVSVRTADILSNIVTIVYILYIVWIGLNILVDIGVLTNPLIEKNIHARGGYEKLKDIKSLKITAKYVQKGRETPIILKIKPPNFIRAEVFFPGQPTSFTYDGKTAWMSRPTSAHSDPQILPEKQAVIFTRYADFGFLFFDYKKRGQKFEMIGIENMDGIKVYKMKTVLKNGFIRFVYLDAKNFLKVKESFKSKNQEPELGMAVYFNDYREVNGILFPYFHEMKIGKFAEQTVIEKIEMNVDMDNSIFKMPEIGAKKKFSDTGFVKELDAYLTLSTERDIFSGVVLFAKEGKPIFKKAYGMADRKLNIPNQANTKFHLGSMNKMFTAVTIAQLVEQEKLSYDDFIGKYLGTGWVRPEVGKTVKISHLLTHTSGIAEYLTDELLNSSADIYRTLEDYKALVRKKTLNFKPGTRWQYSNTGYILLGTIIEKVTGKNYFDYIKKHIYGPVGMSNTIDFYPDKTLPGVAMGYEKVDKSGMFHWRKTAFSGKINGSSSGGGYSTVEDLLKFSAALKSNKLIRKESKELHMSEKPLLNSYNYGYGFIIYRSGKFGQIVGHGGAAPGVSTCFRMFLNRGYTVIILSNYSRASLDVLSKIKSLLP